MINKADVVDEELAEWIQKDFLEKYNKKVFFISALRKDERVDEVLQEITHVYLEQQQKENLSTESEVEILSSTEDIL